MAGQESFSDAMKRARNALSEAKADVARFRDIQKVHWKNLAGDLLEKMLQDRKEAERCLRHSDPNIRFVALEVLSDHWKRNQDFAKACEQMACKDPDPAIRACAIHALGGCHRNSNDQRIGKLLATLVSNPQEPVGVRTAAYEALFYLQGSICMWPGRYEDPPTEFRFPEDVNWQLVDDFLSGKGGQNTKGEHKGDIVNCFGP